MALQGTLKDFGIADILQLIGQQQKTGILVLTTKEQEVRVSFKDGTIVATESSTGKKKDGLGMMLVAAELITEAQLSFAIEEQRRTLRRLGDVLEKNALVTAKRFKEMMELQASETLNRLFSWKNGTYAFEPGELELEPEAITPMRAESVLMEGFRMVDEWPVIKRKISRYDLTFDRLKTPPDSLGEEPSDDAGSDSEFDNAFGDEPREERKGDFASLGKPERRVFLLATPGRSVRRIIELSCLGEFETCKALCNLVNLEYLKTVEPAGRNTEMMDRVTWSERLQGFAGRVLAALVLLATLVFAAADSSWSSLSIAGASQGTLADAATLRLISRSQLVRIQAAVDVYRLERGELPQALDSLVVSGLLTPDDLRYPWHEPYYYRRLAAEEFILLPPLR